MSIDNLTIADLKEVLSMLASLGKGQDGSASKCPTQGLDNFAIGKLVVIRTLSAGVWCGYLSQKFKKEVVLTQARRVWWWHCTKSISLSGVVAYGIDQEKSKVAPPVPYVWLEALEILPITGDAAKSIMEAKIAQGAGGGAGSDRSDGAGNGFGSGSGDGSGDGAGNANGSGSGVGGGCGYGFSYGSGGGEGNNYRPVPDEM